MPHRDSSRISSFFNCLGSTPSVLGTMILFLGMALLLLLTPFSCCSRPQGHRSSANTCKELYFDRQYLDHFNSRTRPEFWSQRYLLNDTYWHQKNGRQKGPIFFYAGNESPVELYANWTGLMWEQAEEFGALVVFAEHRYYGKSMPFGPGSLQTNPSMLSVEQAMMDYVELASFLKTSMSATSSPIILFGGSYGGMLAAWLRMKFPHIFLGAIAGSAPVGAFVSSLTGYDPSSFWERVTWDATPEAGAEEGCVDNTRRTFNVIFEKGKSDDGRAELQRALQLCAPLQTKENVTALAYWIQGAFDSYAMGNYPYESYYIAGRPDAPLPAWPMREACKSLVGKLESDTELLQGMKGAVDVLYNVTQGLPCHKLELTGPAGGPGLQTYLYLWCTQAVGQELPFFPANGATDMFWDQGPYNQTKINEDCNATWGVVPRPDHLPLTFGGLNVESGTNIVWSNGLYDPWHPAGVLKDVHRSSPALIIEDGAHHLDLMFSHPDDPKSVRRARREEVRHMKRWVRRHYKKLGIEWEFGSLARA